ncbi:MAG: DUF2062 domain-containing protein [Alphaproteobacteria bacterium]|nr:DUF2062 domain-containing protein [Alphaproteobacteria bacterium]
MVKHKKYTLKERCQRLLKMKLVVPVMRLSLPPEVKAMGVGVGLFWAMTPLVGIQMWIVFMTWLFFKKVLHIDFSLVLGIAYTWVTNVFTMIPIYYIFYVTGQIMRGKIGDISGYSHLSNIFKDAFMGDLSFYEKWVLIFKILLKDWGISMAIGCLPWAIVCSVVGYRLTLKFEKYRLERINKVNS